MVCILRALKGYMVLRLMHIMRNSDWKSNVIMVIKVGPLEGHEN